jgi:hypothetical protein
MALFTFANSTAKLRDEYRPNGNPPREVARRKPPKGDGFATWTAEQKAAYRDRWAIGTPARLAFEILSWVGARTCDTRRLGRQMVGADGWLTFQQP